MSTPSLSHQQVSDLCRSLAQLLHSGFSAADACSLLAGEESGSVKTLLTLLQYELDQGTPLGEALQQQDLFPVTTAALIHAGELTGHPEDALTAASRYHDYMSITISQLRGMLGYPLFLFALMLVIIGVLLMYVLPVFDSVYASLGTSMTGMAGALLGFGVLLKKLLPGLFCIFLLVFTVCIFCRLIPAFRSRLVSRFRRLVDDRWLAKDFQNAQFIQALSMAASGALVTEDAIRLAGDLLSRDSRIYQRYCLCTERMENGTPCFEALHITGFLDGYSCRMLSLSQKNGNTDRILADIAERMQQHAQRRLQDYLNRIEPAMVLVSSLLVGLILLTVMLPLLQILSSLG